jgi:hypothetical protein
VGIVEWKKQFRQAFCKDEYKQLKISRPEIDQLVIQLMPHKWRMFRLWRSLLLIQFSWNHA